MRELKFKDVFKFSEIVDKMGLRADINSLFDEAKAKGEEGQAWLGGQMTLLMLAKVHNAEKETYSFIADLTGRKPVEVENMSLAEVKDVFKELFEKNDVMSFFSSATAENK